MMQLLTQHADNKKIARMIFRYKGLDEGLFLQYQSSRQEDFVRRFYKECFILAETGVAGAGARTNALLRRFETDQDYASEHMERDLNALIEYGMLFDDLAPDEQGMVARAELAQESGHFSRIMGLDKILQGHADVPSAQDSLNDTNDFARFLMLVCERRVERGYGREMLSGHDGDAKEGGDLIVHASHGVLRKNGTLCVAGVLYPHPGIPLDQTVAKEVLGAWDKFLAKYPFAISLALLDYYCFLRGIKSLQLTALRERVEEGRPMLDTFAIGSGGVLCVAPKPGGQFFERQTVGWSRDSGFEEETLGEFAGTRYTRDRIMLPPRSAAFLFSHDMARLWEGLKEDATDRLLNAADQRGKVLVFNNLQNFFVQQGLPAGLVHQQLGVAQETVRPVWDQRSVVESLAVFDIPEVFGRKGAVVNIEAGHVHADRKLSQTQIDGVHIANGFVAHLHSRGVSRVERVAMVDEYHVLNRLDYAAYEKTLTDLGFPLQELILESSPLIKEIAVDILKRYLEQEGVRREYAIGFEGDNVYLHLFDGSGVVELVEGVSGNFTIGCVLFDAALCMYKRYREQASAVYRSLHNLPADYDVHRQMLGIYKHTDAPEQRRETVEAVIPAVRYTLDGVKEALDKTPYLDAFDVAPEDQHSKILVNVLEDFYRPQQAKLNEVLVFLREAPLFSLYFNNSGKLLLEQSRIERLRSEGTNLSCDEHECGSHDHDDEASTIEVRGMMHSATAPV